MRLGLALYGAATIAGLVGLLWNSNALQWGGAGISLVAALLILRGGFKP